MAKKRARIAKPTPVPRREAILQAAKDVFSEQGYELATMDDIAERARTTKRTVYAHFENKETLFAAMVEHSAGVFMQFLGELDHGGSNYQAELERFANRFCELSTFRHAVQFQRVIIAESKRFPKLSRSVSTSIEGKASAMLARYLHELDRRGKLKVADPKIAAEQFLSITTGSIRLATLFGLIPPVADPNPSEPNRTHAKEIRRAVEVFLRGIRAK
ncbi:MAG TPA: TetR/AcrR family transcriptional regulator [Candidatus Dormibacteraeota bacterium]|nr:TetR/AcrR family transcriptional regulator [Candidatus Dormibacteraeota bacterium]